MRVLELSHFESVPTRGIKLHELGMLFSNVSLDQSSYGDTILQQGVKFSISSASEKRKSPNLV